MNGMGASQLAPIPAIGTVTKDASQTVGRREGKSEGIEELAEVGGGAGRDRTAASQFCRLLPYHLGTAPHEGGIIVASFS